MAWPHVVCGDGVAVEMVYLIVEQYKHIFIFKRSETAIELLCIVLRSTLIATMQTFIIASYYVTLCHTFEALGQKNALQCIAFCRRCVAVFCVVLRYLPSRCIIHCMALHYVTYVCAFLNYIASHCQCCVA